MTDDKAHSQRRFGTYAQGYVTSQTHAKGADLNLLLGMAKARAHWRVLDVATGGGHTALKLARYVSQVVATDLTPKMLEAASAHIHENGQANVLFAASDAENLAFARESFDLVTCRIAPHHFPDVFRFVQECARVLKPGGFLLVQDHVLPDDELAARYIDAFESLRDPSHNRAYAEYEWRGLFLDAGLTVERTETISKTHTLVTWAERQGCPPEIIARLQLLLVQAPDTATGAMRPQHIGTPEATFDNNHLLILGKKPA